MEFPPDKTDPRMSAKRKIRQLLQLALSPLPFHLTLKLVELLRGSQGLGSGASVSNSGEIKAVCTVLRSLGESSPVILDVGANRGEYTDALLRRFPSAKCFLFEPSPETFALLTTRITGSNIVLLNFGLADSYGKATLYKSDPHSRIGSLSKLPISKEEFQEDIELRRLDDAFLQFGVTHIDLLKIDVEGHELAVLRGARNLLEKRLIRSIQFEFGEFNLYSRIFFKDIPGFNLLVQQMD